MGAGVAVLLPVARQQFFDGNGAPLVGGSVAYAQPGTGGNTLRPVYADMGETIPLMNPVPLDSSGITFSGGSQVSVWGFGEYEQFVRDNQGNLIYSAILDTPGGLTGGTIQGSVQINGDLSVVGNITDTQSLTTPTINGTNASFGGSVNISGNLGVGAGFSANTVTTNYLVSNGDLQVDSSATIDGNLEVGGTINSGALGTNYLSVTGNGANFNGTTVDGIGLLSADTVETNSLLVDGQPIQRVQGGAFSTNENNFDYTVTFPAPFNNLISVSVSNGISVDGDGANEACTIVGVGPDQMTISVPFAANPSGGTGLATSWTIFWMAIGT